MSFHRELVEYHGNLRSTKLTERRVAVEKFADWLNNGNIIPHLNSEDPFDWTDLLEVSQHCLKLECDKFADTVSKKGVSKGPDKYLSNGIELVVCIVKTALKQGDDKIDVPLLLRYIEGCLRERNMRVCRDPFLRLVKEHILSNQGCLGFLKPEDFIMLFSLLKSEVSKCNNSDSNNVIMFTCFNLLIKNGPLCAFPPSFLREQFTFLSQLCQSISSHSPRAQQEVTVEILLNFCTCTAEDNRLNCCKLGEMVFSTLLDLYCAAGHDSTLKVNVIEFFLLQIVIHNPNGALEGSSEAVASNWRDWKSCIKKMYNLLIMEVSQYLKQCVKNTLFFVPHKKTTVILDSFICLFVEVCKQLLSDFESPTSVSSDGSLDMHTQIHKKRKVETSLEGFITEIEETKSWVWVKLVGSVLKTYPQLITKKTFLNLLQILHTLQLEVKDSNTVSNIYEIQTILIDIESTLEKGHEGEIHTLWKLVGDSTLRAVGLNQHVKQSQSLLQKLIHRNSVNVESVIQTFSSGVLIITEHHSKTLHLVLENLDLSQLDISKKEELYRSFLSSQNVKDYRCFLKNDFASILVALTLKNCPNLREFSSEQKTHHMAYKNLVDLYSKTEFMVQRTNNNQQAGPKENASRSFNLDTESLQLFTHKLAIFVETSLHEPIDRILCIVGLLQNVLSVMVDFQVIHEDQIKENPVYEHIVQLFGLPQITSLEKYKSHSDRVLKETLSLASILDDLFSLKNHATCVVKEALPMDFLRGLTEIINFFQDVAVKKTQLQHTVKVSLTKVLSKYCLVSKALTATKRQLQIMQSFARPDYDFTMETDYDLAMSFLQNLHLANPGVLSEEIAENILECLRVLCQTKYKDYKCSMDVLNILKYFFKHLERPDQNYAKAVQLLQEFFNLAPYYGPDISILVLDGIEELCKVDPSFEYSLWNQKEIIKFVPEFLKSDFQRVRYRAIEVLVQFFKSSSGTTNLETIHRVEELLELMYQASVKVFDVEGDLTEERRIDEVIFRACSALYAFLSVIICCNSWIEECLFAIIKLEKNKGLYNVSNGELMTKVIRCLQNYYQSKDFMKPYIETLLNKWISLGYDLNDFQFRMLGCSDKKDLYVNYFDICLPLLLKIDRNDLFAAAKSLNLTEKQVFERCCTKIFGRALATDSRNVGDRFTEKNVVVSYVSQVMGSRFKENLIENIDQVVLSLLGAVTDEKDIKQSLGESILFTNKQLLFNDFKKCLHFIESFLCKGISITDFLSSETRKNKMQRITLELQSKIYSTLAEQQINSFHHYTIFIDLIYSSLKSSPLSIYFLRETIYFLTYLIQNTNLGKPATRYLFTFLRRILPERCQEFQHFFLFTVNSLKKIFAEQQHLREICIEMLEYLIVTNEEILLVGIKKLDSFPSTAEFDKVRTIHSKVKYEKKQLSLEDEIKYFLGYSEMAARQDSLHHLKTILSEEKLQLKALYEKLNFMRGFSEDCEESLLHKLTSLLIKMSCYPNDNISQAAVRCLGELGPADLRTIVLEPEKKVLDYKCTPSELLTGHVLSLLTQYIVDSDIKVVKEASIAMYEVLKFKECKTILESSHDFGYGPIIKDFLAPYLCNPEKTFQIGIDLQVLRTLVNDPNLWCPKQAVESNEWITSLVLALLESFDDASYLKNLVPLCQVKVKFSENLLPLLIYLMLSINNTVALQILSTNFNEFFNEHWNLAVSSSPDKNLAPLNKKAVKCMLDVINFIRQQPTISEKLKSLKLNYLAIAKAAAFCSAHFSALLYAELWCHEKIDEFENQKCKEKTFVNIGHSVLDVIYESVDKKVAISLQQIMQGAYKSIGDLDALSGCGMPLLLRPEQRVEYYKNIGNWEYVMNYYTMHPLENESARHNLIESFKMNGLYQLPLLFENVCKEPEYECLWRMGQWNLTNKDSNETGQIYSDQYSKHQYASLKSLCENDDYMFDISKAELSQCIINKLKHISLESSKNLYPISSQLQSLVELEDCFKAIKTGDFKNTFNKWKNQDLIIRRNDFQFVEPIAAQRITILGEYVKKEPTLLKQYFDIVLNFADYAKEELHVRVAENAIIKIRKLSDLDKTVELELQFREAQLAWLNGNKTIALQLLRILSKDESIMPRLKASCLKLQGIYMAEMYSDRTSILNSFRSSIQMYNQLKNDRTSEDLINLEDTYDRIATFADREYQQIMNHIKSDLFQKKLSNIKSCKEMAQAMSDQKRKKSVDEQKAQIMHQKQIKIDENEVNLTLKEKDLVLQEAVKFYVENLYLSDLNNIKIFRVMALFLDNRDNKHLLETLKKMVEKIPTYKYITMLPQLIPHISTNAHDLFGQQINQIIEKCAVDHPHHTLPLLLALVNANKDKEYTNPRAKISGNERSLIALSLVKKLRKKSELSEIIEKMQRLSEALIELAYFVDNSGSSRKNEFKIPSRLKIHKIKDYNDILVPTISLPVSKANTYNEIVGISKFSNTYKTVGGINAPKRIECQCSHGKNHYQLVKGQDDLRQDAVMQQVFTIMTDLLSTNKQTKGLLIRTYKIVPLSMRSGILEWVANSMPIGDYLTGNKDMNLVGAHREFRPQDKTSSECRDKFKGCSGKPVETKLAVFNAICREFKPVFHKFFETYFRQPSVWYERKRAYIHSVATTSMCGYILGIGDRHVSNILIDKQTAEVIHIDFGIAFEQGKVLPTPETVPFRLTRDIVDGMGVSGTEGLFRKSCEKTMEVLRSNSQTILTILEVLLYDPLYFWTVSSAEANKRQTDEDFYNKDSEESEDENKNVSAQRALLRLRGKLQGTEEGKPTSVEHQVGTLIQQAMDPANLCRLFNGWQPYI